MFDLTLAILGSIFFFGGLIILFIGYIKGTTNVFFWSLFPILHGVHEYIEFLLDNQLLTEFFERFELFFALCSSFVLLAACIEYLGIVSAPNGKLIGFMGILSISYFILLSPTNLFSAIHDTKVHWGSITTTYIRLLHGFVIPFISAMIVMFSYYILIKQEKEGKISVNTNITESSMLLIVGLVTYSIFEGFNNSDAIDLLRGISAILLLLIPLFIIIYSSIGLQNLIVFDSSSGRLIYLHNFQQNENDMSSTEKDAYVEKWILTAGVLSAISSLSSTQTSMGQINRINSDKGTFLIAKTQKYSVAIQSQTINRNLESSLLKFQNLFDSKPLSLNENVLYFETSNIDIAGYIKEAFYTLV